MKAVKLLFLIIVLNYSGVKAQEVQPFKQGERVVFFGNSITDYGHYHSYIWLYYMTHFPNRRIDIFNSGVKGHTIEKMYKRLDTDVLNWNPTIIALTFGMNDTGYLEFFKPDADALVKANIDRSYKNYLLVEKRLQALPQIKKIMMSSPPYDQNAKNKMKPYPKKQAATLKIVEFQQRSATANKWPFVDFNRDMVAILDREQKKDSTFSFTTIDRIHPDVNGHLVMAYIFLKKQGLEGQDVANVKIDVLQKKTLKAVNCTVSNLSIKPRHVKFTYLAKSLPFPIDTARHGTEIHKVQDALAVVPFTKGFDNEMLTVKGLKGEQYLLKIDDKDIGEWSAKSLANGINLAEQNNTPQYQQALKIMQLNEKRWTLERNMRDYAWIQYDFFADKGLLFADNQAALDTLKKDAPGSYNPFLDVKLYQKEMVKSTRDEWQRQMNELTDQIYTENKPVKHIIEIIEK